MSDDGDKADERSEMWSSELNASDSVDTTDAKGATDTTDTADTESSMDTADTETPKSKMDAMDATEWDVDSIREAWNPNSIRLPDSIQGVFASEYKCLDWQLEQAETDFSFSKDRYYKPLVVALGLQQLQAMEPDEIADSVAAMEQQDLFDD
jgi:hypothetical protein